MTGNSRSAAWPAYLLTVFAAGLGHLYLGQVRRGAIWFATYLLAVAFLSARTIEEAIDPASPFVVTALSFDSVGYWSIAVPLTVLIVCLIDVYAQVSLENGPA